MKHLDVCIIKIKIKRHIRTHLCKALPIDFKQFGMPYLYKMLKIKSKFFNLN